MQNITKNEELILSSIVRLENFDMQHIKPILAIRTFEEIRRAETKPFVKWV